MSEDTTTAAGQFTDSTTEEEIEGKAYILKTSEGEEVVDPKRLFAGAPDLDDVLARLDRIERELGLSDEPEQVKTLD